MSHYFIEDPSLRHHIQTIAYYFKGIPFQFTTDAGVFSKDHIDPATDLLLRTIPPLTGELLDLGCGYGCIGIVLAKAYGLTLTQADVNQSAVDLARLNAEANGVPSRVIRSDCFAQITGTFDTIAVNPPIHAGKSVTYRMYEEAFSHLKPGGRLFVVTLKKHGAESTCAKLEEIFHTCDILYKKKGYYVICCTKAEHGESGE